MKKAILREKIVDIFGLFSYVMVMFSCFLPFLKYATLTGNRTIDYFQGNGKLILLFSILAIVLVFIKEFNYLFLCFGLSVGIFIYDVTLGLVSVVEEKTSGYNYETGFYLLLVGLIMNLLFIALKRKSVFFGSDDRKKESVTNNVLINGSFDDDDEIIEIDEEEIIELDEQMKKDIETKIEQIKIKNAYGLDDNIEIIEDDEESKPYEKYSPFKLCDKCGMQINSEDKKCPVCGNNFER